MVGVVHHCLNTVGASLDIVAPFIVNGALPRELMVVERTALPGAHSNSEAGSVDEGLGACLVTSQGILRT